MPVSYQTIYLRIVAEKKGLPADLSIEEIRRIPCHEIYFHELEEHFFEIRFKPQQGVTEEMVLEEHLRALRRKYRIRAHEVYDASKHGLIKR